jgi:hypothetical protein
MELSQAKSLATEFVAARAREIGVPLLIQDDETVERAFGWVFFYAVDSSRSDELIAGNGPLIVDRKTEVLHPCGTAQPDEWYIDLYEKTGSVDEVQPS